MPSGRLGIPAHLAPHAYGVDIDVKAINARSTCSRFRLFRTRETASASRPSFTTQVRQCAGESPRTAERERLPDHGPDLARILSFVVSSAIRAGREEWKKLHAEVRKLSADIARTEIETAFSGVFGEIADLARRPRPEGWHLPCFEVEFPEVFFTATGKEKRLVSLREKPGFDVVVGNPPWEEPAAEHSKAVSSRV